MQKWGLGGLDQPDQYKAPLEIDGQTAETLSNVLANMVRIRAAERQLAEGRREGVIGGPVHLGIGQEAVAVGVSQHLRSSDRVFGAHRSHSHILALGAELKPFFAEVLGRDTGLSRGMGGSMHMQDRQNGFYGSVPIVAGTVPLAVGAALAAKMDGNGDVAVAYLGDGAVEEGVVQESLNLAAIMNVPVIFVVENNLFASHMHISLRQNHASTCRFADAHGLEYQLVDGNDIVKVSEAANSMIDAARHTGRPGFIEAVTYRWLGHVDWREDIDVGVSRSSDDIIAWKGRCPIKRLNEAMVKAGISQQDALSHLEEETKKTVAGAWHAALGEPYPDKSATLDRVYSDSISDEDQAHA